MPNPSPPDESDLEYFQKKLDRALERGHSAERARKQLELIEDAVLIYKLKRPQPFQGMLRRNTDRGEDALDMFWDGEWKAIPPPRDSKYSIPSSLMVNIFMRKIQNGRVDRR